MKRPILVVMAAGMGSRYGGLKQIDPVGGHGEAILDYTLFDARRAGFETVVFIIKHEIEEAFKATVGARVAKSGMEIRYAFQQLEKLPAGYAVPEGRVKPWGTAHAILAAADQIDAPFAVVNADDYYGPEAFKVMFDRLSQVEDDDKYEYAMVGFLLKNTVSENGHVSRGVCESDGEGYLTRVTERTRIETYEGGIHYSEDGGESWCDLPADAVVSMNLWGFTPAYVRDAKAGFAAFLKENLPVNPLKCEYYLPTVVTNALNNGEADVAVALTGIAGPDGGTAEKPVGLVWVGAATKDGVWVKKLTLGNRDGESVRQGASLAALDLVRRLTAGLPLRHARALTAEEALAGDEALWANPAPAGEE